MYSVKHIQEDIIFTHIEAVLEFKVSKLEFGL